MFVRATLFALAALFAGTPLCIGNEQVVSTVIELQRELAQRDIDLVFVRMPVRGELYPEKESHFSDALEELHPITSLANHSAGRLEEGGVPVINLFDTIREMSLEREIFLWDRFHFTPEADFEIAKELVSELSANGVKLQHQEGSRVLFMGECFADNFGGKLIENEVSDALRVLNKNGGGALVHNDLFLFPEEYLSDLDTIVWIFTDRHFANPDFAPLETEPEFPEDSTPVTVDAEIVSGATISREQAATHPYPDALRASQFRNSKTGETFVGIDRLMTDRELGASRKFRDGVSVRLRIVPWLSKVKSERELGEMFLLDETGDFALPRYWIEGWVFPAKSESLVTDEG